MENYQHQQKVDITLMDGTMEIKKITENDTIVDITENTELTAKWIGQNIQCNIWCKWRNIRYNIKTSSKMEMPYGELPNATKEG